VEISRKAWAVLQPFAAFAEGVYRLVAGQGTLEKPWRRLRHDYPVCLVQRIAQASSPLPWMIEQAPIPSAPTRFPLALALGDINLLKDETCL
jgi:hypothetical protein